MLRMDRGGCGLRMGLIVLFNRILDFDRVAFGYIKHWLEFQIASQSQEKGN